MVVMIWRPLCNLNLGRFAADNDIESTVDGYSVLNSKDQRLFFFMRNILSPGWEMMTIKIRPVFGETHRVWANVQDF